jgi:hypothetical protein
MHAELTVAHSPGNVVALISASLPSHDPDVVLRSVALANEPVMQGLITLAVEGPTYRLLCSPNTQLELQAFVEAVAQADLKNACQTVWDSMQESGKPLRVRLSRLEITDETSGRPLLTGTTSFGARLGQVQTVTALTIALVSLVFMIAGLFTFSRHAKGNLAAGSAPALAAGVIAFLWSWFDSRRGRLTWQG